VTARNVERADSAKVKVGVSALVVVVLAGCGSASARLSSHPSTTVPAPTHATGPVYVLGDSLTLGMVPYLPPLLPGRRVDIDGKIGRTATDGLAIVATRRASLPPTVVVALGTNDVESSDQFAAVIDQIMALLGNRRVIWVNIASPTARPFNRDLAAARARFRNLELIDWASLMAAHPEDLVFDHIHCTPAGYQLRAAVTAWALQV
jgi:lysophospholipase L1-like esterase